MYIFIVTIIIACVLIFNTLHCTKKIRKNNKDQVSFITSVLATFIGVFLAVHFANTEKEKNIDAEIKKILETVYSDSQRVLTGTSLNYYLAVKVSKNGYKQGLNSKYVQFPHLLKKVLSQENALNYFSPNTFGILSTQIRILNRKYHELVSKNNIEKSRLTDLEKYCYILAGTLELIHIDYLYANNEIGKGDVDSLIAYYFKKNFNTSTGELPKQEAIRKFYKDYSSEFEGNSNLNFVDSSLEVKK